MVNNPTLTLNLILGGHSTNALWALGVFGALAGNHWPKIFHKEIVNWKDRSLFADDEQKNLGKENFERLRDIHNICSENLTKKQTKTMW